MRTAGGSPRGIDLHSLKQRVDLVALGQRHGVQWVPGSGLPRALCPFHDEDTPSFVAYQEPEVGTRRFECFGTCARTWDAIAFVQEKTGLGFAETVRELAAASGMTVSPAAVDTAQLRAEKDRREEILQALEAAQEYLAKALQADHPMATRARAYLAEREMEEAVGPWGIGYAPGTVGLARWLRDRGFTEALLLDAYLLRPGKEGRPAYEFQRNRLTLPVRDRRGRIVAHVGRSVPDDDGRAADPKYLNPGKVPGVYAKRETLFGLYEAREAIRKAGFAWVVEGPLDAVRLHLAGLPPRSGPGRHGLLRGPGEAPPRGGRPGGDLPPGRRRRRREGPESGLAGLPLRGPAGQGGDAPRGGRPGQPASVATAGGRVTKRDDRRRERGIW